MRSDGIAAGLAACVLAAACSGGGTAPDVGAPEGSAPTTSVADPGTGEAGVPRAVIDRAADRLDGTALEGLTDGEITADVLDGCATADRRDADAFAARLSEIVAGRVTRAGEPPGGEASAAYSSVLEAAFREVCPAGFSAVADGGGGPAETVFAEETDSALEALGIGLEGTAFEGLPDDRFPAAELAAVLEGVCTKVEGGGSNVDVADLVAGEFLQRFDADRQQVDHLVAVVSTAAVTYLCPEYAETVLGP